MLRILKNLKLNYFNMFSMKKTILKNIYKYCDVCLRLR